MNQKGMTIGMVFVFVLAMITFAVVMIFGYQAITDFMTSGEKVEFYQFKTDLEGAVKKIYTEYGSVRVETFYLPASYEEICFVDLDAELDSTLNDKNPIACDVWDTAIKDAEEDEGSSPYEKADQNVFLKPLPPEDSPVIKVYKLKLVESEEVDGEKIETQKGYLCLDVNRGRFKLRLEGMGDRTKISRVIEE